MKSKTLLGCAGVLTYLQMSQTTAQGRKVGDKIRKDKSAINQYFLYSKPLAHDDYDVKL